MANTLITLLILIASILGIVLLQIYLSKKDKMWQGLILPIICVLISFIAVLNIPSFTPATTISSGELTAEHGAVVQEITPEVITQGNQSTPSLIFTIVSVLLLYNIPTAILLAIFFVCRNKQHQKNELEKMKAQDLK